MDNESNNVENSVKQAVAGSSSKPDTGKRIIAFVIDGFIGGALSAVLGFLPIVGPIIGTFGALAYLLVKDGLDFSFMDKRSIGKKIMKLRPVRVDGQEMDLMSSVKRNFTIAIPFLNLFEAFKVLTDNDGLRIGDGIGETKVIEVDS